MPDLLTTIGRSTIQHGPDNDRVYLMELNDADMPDLLARINDLAEQENYGKIFAKLPAGWAETFAADGFRTEALVPDFFKNGADGHFMAKYLDPARADDPREQEIERILAISRDTPRRPDIEVADEYSFRRCTLDDCDAMAERYGTIFTSYPFPVDDPNFLATTMAEHVIYFGVWQGDELVALASAEQYRRGGHVEMTDFLTVPEHRRQGLAGYLLAAMDRELRKRGLAVAYTIARALSVGINVTFARAGYRHAGTLINNTQICGNIESMQVWYKYLC